MSPAMADKMELVTVTTCRRYAGLPVCLVQWSSRKFHQWIKCRAYTVTVTDSRGCTVAHDSRHCSTHCNCKLNLSSTASSCGNANGSAIP
ncbi:MAG: hypothetical protein IPN36_07040 [Bacteroidetes bacterium]|nr:hypothetical protein [Bacteroidota bacterium]